MASIYASIFVFVGIVVFRLFCNYRIYKYGTNNRDMMYSIFLNITFRAEEVAAILFSVVLIFQVSEFNTWINVVASLVLSIGCLYMVHVVTNYFVDFLSKKYRKESFFQKRQAMQRIQNLPKFDDGAYEKADDPVRIVNLEGLELTEAKAIKPRNRIRKNRDRIRIN